MTSPINKQKTSQLTGSGGAANTPGDKRDLDKERMALEWERLRSERQKSALEFRLKRRELAAQSSKAWRELLANPVTLAIVGGFITLMTTIVTNHLTVSANLQVEVTKAELAAAAASKTLQADLIKKFVESPKTETVRENLRFLVDAGLLPDYGDRIKAYLANNAGAPEVGLMMYCLDQGGTPEFCRNRVIGTPQ
jgi:hypothetical protein